MAAVLFVQEPASAQKTTFDPSIALSYYRAEDLDLAGMGDSRDDVIRLSAILPVERQLRKGTLRFSYAPQLEQFQDFDELDNDGHRLSLDLTLRPSRSSTFNLGLGFRKTLDQGDASSSDDEDLFLNRRTDREIGTINLSYSNRLSARWNWRVAGGHSEAMFEDIPGFDSGQPLFGVEDRTTQRGALGINREVSRRTQVGVEYARREFDLDLSGDQTTNLLGLTVNHRLGQESSLSLTVGAFESTGRAAGRNPDELNPSREGGFARVSVSRQFKTKTLQAYARVEPSSGGAREGTSVNSVVGLTLANASTRRWNWNGSVRYAERDATDDSQEDLDSVTVGLQTEVRVWRFLSLRLGANYVDQNGRDERLRLFTGGGLSLVWYPLAGKRISGRSGRPIGVG